MIYADVESTISLPVPSYKKGWFLHPSYTWLSFFFLYTLSPRVTSTIKVMDINAFSPHEINEFNSNNCYTKTHLLIFSLNSFRAKSGEERLEKTHQMELQLQLPEPSYVVVASFLFLHVIWKMAYLHKFLPNQLKKFFTGRCIISNP